MQQAKKAFLIRKSNIVSKCAINVRITRENNPHYPQSYPQVFGGKGGIWASYPQGWGLSYPQREKMGYSATGKIDALSSKKGPFFGQNA